jgi:cytoskeletal protein RodZ
MRRGLTLAQVSSDTKILERHLDAIEHDDFAALPRGLYLRGQVRAYARTVHVDVDRALVLLDRQLMRAAAAETVVAPPPPPTRSRPLPWLTFVAAGLVLVVAGAAAARWLSQSQPPAPPTQDAAPPAPAPTAQPAHAPVPIDVPGTSLQPPPADDVESPTASGPEVAPAIAQSDTALSVVTQPPGARVTVDGIGWGTSPLKVRHLSAGVKRVRASLDGYLTAERSVTVEEGRSGTVTIRLRPRTP